ncbi:NAD(+) diphosphatase [Sporobolomyces salmoneus]|uniref:NAD(+) diphosphatase n=1 Tax=Sporobolomyces salmoneus TaxID=183962 RepID=UPI0031778B77
MQNYYAGNPLNRLSYLRSSPAFLTSALRSPKAQFLVLDTLQPLCEKPTDGSTRKFVRLGWERVEQFIGDPEKVFVGVDGKNDQEVSKLVVVGSEGNKIVGDLSPEEKRNYFLNKPTVVFLGVDERSAPESSKSLPLSKPTETSTLEQHSPYGVPYWALDVSKFTELKKQLLEEKEGREFVELRAEAQVIPNDEASIGAEARSLVDWNTRNKFCPGCSRPLRSVWAGWKRSCVPGEPAADGLEGEPACVSKKGVHNYSYPRTDPVVIMAILSPDRESILLGRQRTWPARFYSCLAGFIESGESFEEAVRREVYEEAGVEVDQVGYHSSQPWPYPSSLMLGAWGIAKEGSQIRTDLDNELEDARFFTKQQVLDVIKADERTQLTREEVHRIEGKKSSDQTEEDKKKIEEKGAFRMPPPTAIANTLVTAWANGTLFSPLANPNGPAKI